MNNIFDITTTDMSYYDSILDGCKKYTKEGCLIKHTIKYISPDEYISECARVLNSTVDRQYMMIVKEKLIDIKNATSNNKLPLILIDEVDKAQEGRHRALVAKELGIKSIPVLYVYI